MIKTYCDKCGTEIFYNPNMNTIMPSYYIQKISAHTYGYIRVNLCHDCEKKLDEWLNTKEEPVE